MTISVFKLGLLPDLFPCAKNLHLGNCDLVLALKVSYRQLCAFVIIGMMVCRKIYDEIVFVTTPLKLLVILLPLFEYNHKHSTVYCRET